MSFARPDDRFSRRVFRVFALSLLIVSAVLSSLFIYAQQQRMGADLVDRGRTLATLLASGARTAVYSENATLVQDTLQGLLERPDVLAATIFTEDLAVLVAAAKDPALRQRGGKPLGAELRVLESPLLRSACAELQEGGHLDIFCPVLIRARAASEQDLFFEPSPRKGHEELIGFVQLSLDRAPLRRELAALLLRSVLLVSFLLLAGTGAVFLLSRRVTEPLEQLTEAVRAFGAGAAVREIPRTSQDEIGRLAEAFTAMIRDLEEREREKERLAERLRHAQKMEAVGTLSQGISHDFKNILSTLKAALHILQKGSPDNEFVLKYAGRMQLTLERARELVDRLGLFSRTRELPVGSVDLTALLERLAPALAAAVGEGVRLNLETPGAPVRIVGDSLSLEQLLTNLAYNARDAMPAGGVLCVRLETAAGAAGDEAGTARITVRDTGAGMAPEVQRRAFEPFFSTKEVGAGSGLGLSIVHGIVEQHRGRIRVESGPGEGTCFQVDLPLAAGAEAFSPSAGGARGAVCG